MIFLPSAIRKQGIMLEFIWYTRRLKPKDSTLSVVHINRSSELFMYIGPHAIFRDTNKILMNNE